MIKEDKGQMSVELLFLFALSIIILIVFTIPIGEVAISNTMDVVNTFNTELGIKQIANGIDKVYSQGIGAKQVITVELNKDTTVIIKSKSISTEIALNDGKVKKLSENHKAEKVFSTLNLVKGVNKISISWDEDSNNINIKT